MSGATGRRASALVAGGILLSRIAGLARERVIASHLGVGFAVDSFRAALRIPNLLQNLLGEGVLSASFIPVYARLLENGEEEEAGRVAGAVAGLLAALAGVLVVIGVVFARPLTLALAPGFTGRRLDLTVTLVRILTPGVGALVLSAWCLGVLNTHRRFFLSYVAPVLWNVAQIAVVVAVAASGATQTGLATALAWGALAGGILQLAVQLVPVRRLVSLGHISMRTDLVGVRTAVRRFLPVVAGRGVVQLSAYVDLLLASLLAVGAVSALGYAQVFYLLPISLFGMSVAAAELPELSRMDRPGPDQLAAWQRRLDDSLARIATFVVPAATAYLVMGDLVVATLLRTGRFGADDTRLVWYTLIAFSIGLVASTASRLLQSALYALGDTRTPAAVAVLRVLLSGVIGLLLMFELDRITVTGPGLGGLEGLGQLPVAPVPLPAGLRADPGGLRLGAVGLAAASSIGAWLELVLLRHRVRRTVGPVRLAGGQLGRILAAGVAAGAVGGAMRLAVTALPAPLALLAAGAPAAAAYLIVARALDVTEVADLLAGARGRLRRRP